MKAEALDRLAELMSGPQLTLAFADLTMGQPIGTTRSLGEMERSALVEMGNVTRSLFPNALSERGPAA